MKLLSIKLVDFRQFYGEAYLSFAHDDERSVTLVHGENGVGKTTILNAIHWCLYGKLLEEFEQHDKLVNETKYKNDIATTLVELIFTHNEKIYRVLREYNQKTHKTNSGVVSGFLVDGSNNEPIDNMQTVINRIIPIAMSPYFFFHGEGLNNLGTSSLPFKQAIRSILGFNHADKSIEIIKSIKLKWQKSYAKLSKIDDAAKNALLQEADASELIEKIKNKRAESEANLIKVNEALADINEELAKIKVDNIERLTKKREKLELRKRMIPREVEKNTQTRIRYLSTYGWSIYGFKFMKGGAAILNKYRTERKLPAEYNDVFINDLLKNNLCICGSCLKEGSRERDKVKELLIGAATSDQEEAVTKATGIAENINDVSKEYINRINSLDIEIKQLAEEEGTIERELEEIKEKIIGIDKPRIYKLESDRADYMDLAEKLRTEKHLCGVELANATKHYEEVKRKSRQAVESGKLNEYKLRIEFLDKLVEKIHYVIKTEEASARNEIEELINDRLDKFSRKDYYSEVKEDFTFELKKRDGSSVAKSKGEKALLNMSFISSLIELAKSRSKQSSKYFVQGTVAPFVIDAPFGELDNQYRGAVAKFLPESTEQLVILLSSSHWSSAVEENISEYVGKEYVLISESSGENSGEKTLDKRVLKDKEIECSRYGMAIDRSVIMEL